MDSVFGLIAASPVHVARHQSQHQAASDFFARARKHACGPKARYFNQRTTPDEPPPSGEVIGFGSRFCEDQDEGGTDELFTFMRFGPDATGLAGVIWGADGMPDVIAAGKFAGDTDLQNGRRWTWPNREALVAHWNCFHLAMMTIWRCHCDG
ncbi:MAG: hypothetical protein J2P48_23770 [Alphaproteobacteria bacterium]|nr:hypothetical protein [Alphaproteobacteria bacterium]